MLEKASPAGTAQARFVANFAAARKALDLRQAAVAARMRERGFAWRTSGAVSSVETGRRRLSLDESEALAEIVGVPLAPMLTELSAVVVDVAEANNRVR